MLILRYLIERKQWPAKNACLARGRPDFALRVFVQPRVEVRFKVLAVFGLQDSARELPLRVSQPIRVAQHRGHPVEAPACSAELDVAIRAGIDAAQDASRLDRDPRCPPPGELVRDHDRVPAVRPAQMAIDDREVYVLADARHDRPKDCRRRRRAGFDEARRPEHLHRLSLGDAHRVHLAAEAVEDKLCPFVIPVGAVLAEVRDRDQGNVRVQGMEHIPAQAQAIKRPRPEAFDDHIDPPGQPQEGVASGVTLQVEDDGPLVCVEVEKGPALFDVRFASGERAEAARQLATRRLHLDNVRAVIGQQLGGVGATDPGRQVEHTQVGDGSSHWAGLYRQPAASRHTSERSGSQSRLSLFGS